MRMDKLTSRFQQALADAQSLAVGRDHNLIEPAHLLLALLDQQGGSTRPLLAQAGVNVPLLRERLVEALDKLPKVTGQEGNFSVGNDLAACSTSPTSWRSSAAMPSSPASCSCSPRSTTRAPLGKALQGRRRRQGRAAKRAIEQAARRREGAGRERRGTAPGAGEIHHRPDRARRDRQARPGGRPRRGNPPHHPGAAAAHQEQPGADRRARRGQDRDRRRPGAAHRQRRSARRPAQPPRAVAGHGRADRRRQVPRRVRGAPEGGAQRPVQAGRPGHPVHRRTAHHGRRRQGRRLDGRRQHAQARAGARRTALHRRDHAGRVPQVRGEGRRAGAPLPEGVRRRAQRWRTPSRSCAA